MLYRHAATRTVLYLATMPRLAEICYRDNKGRIRCRQRVFKGGLTNQQPFCYVLSPNSYTAKAICHDYHVENHGSGATFIIGKMLGNREEPTNVVRARIILEKLSNRCIKCRIYRGQVGRAQMGDIPAAKFFFEGAFSHIQIEICIL